MSGNEQVRCIHGDALEVLPTLEGEEIAAVVTDPPYGMGWDVKCGRFSGGTAHHRKSSRGRDWPAAVVGEACGEACGIEGFTSDIKQMRGTMRDATGAVTRGVILVPHDAYWEVEVYSERHGHRGPLRFDELPAALEHRANLIRDGRCSPDRVRVRKFTVDLVQVDDG